MFVLKLIAGPLIGALIGYLTNYIAVKMLFRPHRPVFLFGHRLPFTPGMIPKRKNELAAAVGSAIGDVLLTKKDLAQAIPSESIKGAITEDLWRRFEESKESSVSVGQTITSYIPEERYEPLRERLEDLITEKAVGALRQMDISEIVVREGTELIREKVKGTMLSMMLNEQMIQSIAAPIGEEIENYIEENGAAKIRPIVAGEIARMEAGSLGSLTSCIPLKKDEVDKIVDVLYDTCVEDSVGMITESIDVAGIAETKIKEMDVVALEALIFSVMKKELNAIVNLGALIGFVIGLLNLLVDML